MLVRVGVACCLSSVGLSSSSCKKDDEAPAPEVRIDAQRYRVPLFDDDIAMGGEHPLVTIVIFTDYACPPCGATWEVMDNLVEDYGEDVRVVFRSFTVPGFSRGEQAAEAAFAAGGQGKFWEMHRRLFEHPTALDRPSLRAHAETLGLDVPKFTDELDTGVYSAIRARHRREATRLGIQGLPAAFVNGLYLPGFADEKTWHGIVDAECKKARELMAAGTARADVYDALMKKASTARVGSSKELRELKEQLAQKKEALEPPKNLIPPDPDARYQVDDEGAPAKGPEDAPVLVVEFVDFKCPYCRRAWSEELDALLEKHVKDVRFAVRMLPLPIHPEATGAAKAALAAGRQGKFWEMHDALIAHEGPMGRSDFAQYAESFGIDSEQLLADLDDPKLAAQVEADVELANRLGVTGTPGFFVNGRYIRGFRPGRVDAVIAEELERIEKLRREGSEVEPRAWMTEAKGPEEFPNP